MFRNYNLFLSKYNFLGWNYNYVFLREPKVKSWVKLEQEIQEEVVKELKKNSFDVVDFEINTKEYKQYVDKAKYDNYPSY